MKRVVILAMTVGLLAASAFGGITLGTAETFAVLGASTVTNTGSTQIRGNLGVAAGTAIVGFPPGLVEIGTIYAGGAVPTQAQADLAAALKEAAAQHRRVIVDFGGNWCTDCHVLDSYMHDSTNQPLVDANFFVVHINVGRIDQNLEIAERYGIPLKNGVPAIAVLSSHGKLLYSQTGGEFKDMRHMDSSALTAFLQRWKANAHRPSSHAPA